MGEVFVIAISSEKSASGFVLFGVDVHLGLLAMNAKDPFGEVCGRECAGARAVVPQLEAGEFEAFIRGDREEELGPNSARCVGELGGAAAVADPIVAFVAD